jgi:hypothetical protein
MYKPYVRMNNPFTQVDANPTNPLGCIYSPPVNEGAITTAAGTGAQPVYKYVQYSSTANPATVAGSAPVYYVDNTFTIVSGDAAEAYITTNGAMVAGYLCPNTTSVGATFTAAYLNTGYVWIQIGGYLANAWGPTTGTPGAGVLITGAATGNWASSGTAAADNRILGLQLTAIASSVCTVLVGAAGTFWGS